MRQASTGRLSPAFVAFVATLALFPAARLIAQTCTAVTSAPVGYQEYYVLGRESHVYNMMERVATAEGLALGTNATNSVVSAVASANGQILYYDHWEDGLDTGLNTLPPAPVQLFATLAVTSITRAGTTATVTTPAAHGYAVGQAIRIDGATQGQYNGTFLITAVPTATTFQYTVTGAPATPATGVITRTRQSTLIFGDRNNANGRACEFTNDPRVVCGGTDEDALFDGTALTLDSDNGNGAACTTPGTWSCSVPLPRTAAAIRFDGGDRVVTSGGPLSLIHNQDPLSNFIGGSVEILSRQAYANATSYSIPAGENLYLGNNTPTEIFQYVDIDLVAFQNNTQVTITSPGAGSVSFTLQQGQHYTNRGCATTANPCANGAIDEVTAGVPALVINSGTKISTTAPLAGLIHTGGDGLYATDIFPILPDLLHGSDYLIPSLGDDAAVNGNRPMNLYIFNPDPLNAITVTATDSVGSRTFTVPANGTVSYFDGAPGPPTVPVANRFVPTNSAVRLTSSQTFWGLTSHDHQTPNNDWGYAWLATKFLTTTYTTGFSPGVRNPASASTPGQRTALSGDADCTIPPTGIGTCNSINRSPLWIGATQDNTLVKIDLNGNANGRFDYIDLDSDDCPDNGTGPNDGTCEAPINACPGFVPTSCVYALNALQSLRVFDHTDYDNTATFIAASKPVAVVYGQDTDQATGGDPIQDTGYTVYPTIQAFLEPVLNIDKSATPGVVSGQTGGTVTFTLVARSYVQVPLTNMTLFDDLPVGLTCADTPVGNYVPDSSRITYPDLSQDIGDAATVKVCLTGGGINGRDRITWTLSNSNTLLVNQTLTIEFQVSIPPGGAACFLNDGTARGQIGASTFEAGDQASVTRSDITLSKSVAHDGSPEPGETLTYSVLVGNNGPNTETTVRVTDAVPAGTTFAAIGAVPAPFTGSYNAGTNTVTWSATALGLSVTTLTNNGLGTATVTTASPHGWSTGMTITIAGADQSAYNGSFVITVTGLSTFTYTIVGTPPAGTGIISARAAGPFTLTFTTTINAGLPAGTVISNVAGYESTQTGYFLSAPVNVTVAGPVLTRTKTGPAYLRSTPTPEVGTFDVVVQNTGTGTATNLLITDPIPANSSYVAGSMRWRLNSGPFTALTDAAADDEGTLLAGPARVQFALATLGANQSITFRFQVTATGATGSFINNIATVSSTQTTPADTNLVQVLISNTTITGRLFLDLDNDGTQDPGEPGIPSIDVILTNATFGTVVATTDANGDYVASVNAPAPAGTATWSVVVDTTDPDFPTGLTLTTANNPQNVLATFGANANATAVGYRPPPLTFTKDSDAGGDVVAPGQLVNYTLTLTNNNTVTTHTNITLSDTLPAGVTYVGGSASVNLQTFRVTEYYINNAAPDQCTEAGADFAAGNTTCTLTLNQALASNYFVMIQGSDNNSGANSAPSSDYVSLTDDGFGTGDFPGAVGANQIRLFRDGSANAWMGVVTVVECLRGCASNGFTLLDVQRVAHAGATTAGTDTSAVSWTDLSRVMLMGGVNGAGCNTADATALDHEVCHVGLNPSGANTINWTRDGTDGGLSAATSTVMALQWGSNWNVQRTAITNGNNGGAGIDIAGEYNTAAITPVVRDQTWVWGTGHTDFGETGQSAEGVALTLGNGVAQNATESQIAAGVHFAASNLNFDVYALSHPNLRVDYRFKPNGDVGGGAAQTVNVVTDSVVAAAGRMALVTNSLAVSNGTFPRPLFSARYTANASIALERRRSNADFAAWVQGLDFSRVVSPSGGAVGAPPSLLTGAEGYTLAPGQTMTVTFQVQVNNPLASTINQIANTASLCTAQTTPACPTTALTASHTDFVPRVTIEPNNAGFATAGGTITFTQTVTNTGGITDSYAITVIDDITATSWPVQLLDAATGAVIATDSNADGVWDAGTVNTGTLAPGESRTYRIRVTVPGGTLTGTQNTFRLVATSDLLPAVNNLGFNEVTVVGGTGFVDVLPDNSGVVAENAFVAYAHNVVNNTGAADTFDLTIVGSQGGAGWSRTIHWDTNGDGVYTDGIDLAITNTAALPNGGSQLVFVRVNAPAGSAGLTDVAILTATSRNNTNTYDSASDTTTVLSAASHDLSGGGTRLVSPGDLAVYPGTLENLSPSSGAFEFTISPSSLFGDGMIHSTELWIDSNSDGTPDLMIASDNDGDGAWDFVQAGYDNDVTPDLLPDLTVPAGGRLAYELRRAIDPTQQVPQEFVTLTARAGLDGTGEIDSVTAQWLIAAVTRASIRGLRVDPAGVVEFATGMQRRTRSFNLYGVSDAAGSDPALLNEAEILSPRADSVVPILYRVETRPLAQPFLLIEEIETTGKRLVKGPYSIDDARLRQGFERIEARLDRLGEPRGRVRGERFARGQGEPRARAHRLRRTNSREGIRIEIADAGTVEIPLADLREAGLPGGAGRTLRLTSQDQAVPFTIVSDPVRGETLRFTAAELATDYTGANVYLLTWGQRPLPMQVALTRSAEPALPGFVRIERTFTYLADAPANADPFLWDVLYSDGTSWPYAQWEQAPEWGYFDLPELVATSSGTVAVRVRLVGYNDYRHTVAASINGFAIGTWSFDGAIGATLEGSIPAQLLQPIGNALTLVYNATTRDTGEPTLDGFVYLDFVDIAAPVAPAPRTAQVLSLTPYDPSLPALRGVEYMIVTHPDFREAADRIAALKQAEGLNASVVETDNAYDHWSGGIVEARALQALIQRAAARSRRLKYVLLVGDDTFDPLDFSGSGARSFVPSLLSRDSGFGRIPSENLYADLNGDGSPELAIGRLPVQTAEEANAMADKIANQTALLQAQAGRQLFVADVPKPDDAPFRAEAEEVAEMIGVASESNVFVDVSQGAEQARAGLFSAWQAGAMATHYFGHGGPFLWSDLNLLTVDDVTEHGHTFAPSLLLMWTCDAQWYLNLGPSLGEALFLVPNGGAVASFGPSGIVAPAKHRALYEKVYGSIWSGQTLGEILRRAKADALAEKPGNREVIDGFNLLGDPALKLPARPQAPR